MSSFDEILEGLEKIAPEVPAEVESLNFYIELLKKQESIKEKFLEKFKEGIDKEKVEAAIREGRPAVTVEDVFQLSEEELAEVFTEISFLVQSLRPDEKEAVKGFLQALGSGAFTLNELVKATLSGKDDIARGIAAGANIELDLVQVLVLWSLQPILEAFSEALQGRVDFATWDKGFCPVCGSYTRLGYMTGPGGRLYLKCQICGHEWYFSRLTCPFCGNNEPGTIGFYTIGNDRRFRLYVCKKCGNYWKVVDENVAGTNVPRKLYDVWTLKLDLVAKEKKLK